MKNILADIVAPAVLVFWIAYFALAAFSGATGMRALTALSAEVAREEAALAALHDRKLRLERRADMLNPRSLDEDMVDERVRAVLGYVQKGDMVIPRAELDRLRRTLGAASSD